MKEKGILLPIFSLPGNYGIGDFGNEAYEFIDILSKNNIKYWELLPINEFDSSPYSPRSYYAIEEDYISIDKLKQMGLITDTSQILPNKTMISGDLSIKYNYYKEAFKNFKPNFEYDKFKQNQYVRRYAKYCEKHLKENPEYKIFLQYIINKQFKELKEYANSKNILIVGDMPIYPSLESVDVEFHNDLFEIKNGKMQFISGAAPDDYNPKGQKWGNPVYDFQNMKKDNYSYLINRYIEFLNRYDIVRIDHFKAFDSFFKIPIGGSAQDGEYEEGPGYDFFDTLFKVDEKNINSDRFWVEDLGDITSDTIKLRDYYNFCGQCLTVFSIDLNRGYDNEFDRERVIRYTGNHDTDTVVGWYHSLNLRERHKLKSILRKAGCNKFKINEALIKYCMESKAKVVMVPAQDILGLDSKSRINRPGIISKQNWSWRMKDFEDFKKDIKFFANL